MERDSSKSSLRLRPWYLMSGIPDSVVANVEAHSQIKLYRLDSSEKSDGADRVIYRQGDAARSLYYIAQGGVQLWCTDMKTPSNIEWNDDDPRDHEFDTPLIPGECFGGVSSVSGLPRQTTAVAIKNKPTVLVEFTLEQFEAWQVIAPQLYSNVLKDVCRRVYSMRQFDHALLRDGDKARLIKCLLDMAKTPESCDKNGDPYVVLAKQEEWVQSRLGKSKSTLKSLLIDLHSHQYIERIEQSRYKVCLKRIETYGEGVFKYHVEHLRNLCNPSGPVKHTNKEP